MVPAIPSRCATELVASSGTIPWRGSRRADVVVWQPFWSLEFQCDQCEAIQTTRQAQRETQARLVGWLVGSFIGFSEAGGHVAGVLDNFCRSIPY